MLHPGVIAGSRNTLSLGLTPVTSGRVFQRAAETTSGPVLLSGTYTGDAPQAVEAQVLLSSNNATVVDWTALTGPAPSDGTWSGSISAPQGPVGSGAVGSKVISDSYYVKVRSANGHAVGVTGETTFYVGRWAVCYGQSNMAKFSTLASSPATAAVGTGYYNGNFVSVPAANGIRNFLNSLVAVDGIPSAAINYAIVGQSIANLSKGAANTYYNNLAAAIAAIGHDAETILWHQGEGDVTTAEATYIAALSQLHADICAETGRTTAQMPLLMAGLLSTTGTSYTEAGWDAQQRTLMDCAAEFGGLTDVHYSHSNLDAVRFQGTLTASISGTTLTATAVGGQSLGVGYVITGSGVAANTRITAFGTGNGSTGTYTVNNSQTVSSEAMASIDSLHMDAAAQGRAGQRYARTVTTLATETSGYPNFHITGSSVINDTTTTITVAHSMGTDIAPASGITGFEASENNGVTWVSCSGVRTDATTITLTHASIGANSARKIRYLYGMQGTIDTTTIVGESGGDFAVPLDPSAGNISPTPLSVVPVPTFQSVQQTTGSGTAWSKTGISVGAAAAGLKTVIIGIEYPGNTQTVTVCQIVPNSGSSSNATKIVEQTGNPSLAIFQGEVAAACTSIDVNITYSSAIFTTQRVGVWTVPSADFNSTTPVDSDKARATTATSVSVSISTSAGGFIIAIGTIPTTAVGTYANCTEAFGSRYAVNTDPRILGMDASNTGDATNTSVVQIDSTLSGTCVVAAASWR
ncbi:MAG: sialate O-acetylesterase [Candidatus Paceibacterota bacterium]|jgi:hypothetical protein